MIDNISDLGNGMYRVGGWAAYVPSIGVNQPVESIESDGCDSIDFFRGPRLDFKESGDFAFSVIIDDGDTLARIYYGMIKIVAVNKHEHLVLNVWIKIKDLFFSYVLKSSIGFLSKESVADITRVFLRELQVSTFLPSDTEFESYCLQIGSTSFDDSAIVGRSGYLFLHQGGNSLLAQYSSNLDQRKLNGWIEKIVQRNDFCKTLGVDFFQIIVPEKQSVMPEYYPSDIGFPTPLLLALTETMSSQDFYLDLNKIFRDNFVFENLSSFRQVDTHLSLHGATAVISILMEKFGNAPDIWPKKTDEKIMGGDLGNKFFSGHISEKVIFPLFDDWDFGNITPRLEESFDPKIGHSGVFRRWICDSPVYKKRVLIFGNSVFERGGTPLGLSWWCSRIFEETIFVWSSDVDFDLIKKRNPDVVICQTVERFLVSVPNC